MREALKSLKNPGFSTRRETREFAHYAHEFPAWQEFIFLQKRKRFFPKNAALPYTPPNLIEDGEVCGPPHAPPGFVNGLRIPTDLKDVGGDPRWLGRHRLPGGRGETRPSRMDRDCGCGSRQSRIATLTELQGISMPPASGAAFTRVLTSLLTASVGVAGTK